MSVELVLDTKPVHAVPAHVTHDGMMSAALDTVKQNIADTDVANVLIGYSHDGTHKFSFDFNTAESVEEVQAAWSVLKQSGADMWYSVLYGPFKFDAGDVISTRRMVSVVLLTGNVRGDQDRKGMIMLLRPTGLVLLPMTLKEVVDGTPHFEFAYHEGKM